MGFYIEDKSKSQRNSDYYEKEELSEKVSVEDDRRNRRFQPFINK
jgi:hypothetical protein